MTSRTSYIRDGASAQVRVIDDQPTSTPVEQRMKLCKIDGEPLDNVTEYHQLIGCLQYLINDDDDQYAINQVS